MSKYILISRFFRNDKQTLGVLNVIDSKSEKSELYAKTVELPWKDNQRNISCIPPGKYPGELRTSEKYGLHVHIKEVPDRSYILIHPANFVRQLRGCIAPGKSHTDIDGDGYRDVISSRDTVSKIVAALPRKFDVIIEESNL